MTESQLARRLDRLERAVRVRDRALLVAAGLAGLLMASTLMADYVVPNTFVNGTVANADEVNANFDFIEGFLVRSVFIEWNAGDPVVTTEYGDWLDDVTPVEEPVGGTDGEIQINFDPDFAVAPVCVCTNVGGGGFSCDSRVVETTHAKFRNVQDTTNVRYNILCTGQY